MKKYLLISVLMALFISACEWGKGKYDFELQGADGDKTRLFSLRDFRGQALVLYFGYTQCPDVCPAALSIVSEVLESHNLSDKVKIVFISLDPQRDSPNGANEYVRYFYPNSQALIPSQKELKELAKVYGVRYERIELPDSELGYSIAHSSSVYVFGANGEYKGEISNLIGSKIIKKLKDFGILEN